MAHSHRITILYGSETGNAEDFAVILSHKLRRLRFPHTLSTIGNFDPKWILNTRYLFILCSTTGQGELPRNARERSIGSSSSSKGENATTTASATADLTTLWTFLKRRDLPNNFLDHVNVAFFGLGDSSYPRFNYAIRKLHTRIVGQLGAKELFDRLEADEQGLAGSNKNTGAGVEAVYFEFERLVIESLLKKFPQVRKDGQLVPRVAIDDSIYIQPSTFLQLDECEEHKVGASVDRGIHFVHDNDVKYGEVVSNKRLTSEDHFQDVRQFQFRNINADDTDVYSCGDTVCLYPCNSDASVQNFLELQPHWLEMADKPLKFTNGIPEDLEGSGLVQPLTLRNILKYHCDLHGIPRASFFLKIWMFATDVTRMERGQEQLEQQRSKLRQFGTDKDMQDLYDYCNRPRRSLLEVVEDFLSLRIPWEYCLDCLPRIKPRYYSISSRPNDPVIELTVAVVKYKTIIRKIRTGLCTKYISHTTEGDRIRYKLCKNNLLNDKYRGRPLILACTGVGLAPMLSIIKAEPLFSNNIHLFFGCRIKEKDFIMGDLLETWSKEGRIHLHPVFSRDRKNSPDTKYIQDSLWDLAEPMTKLIVQEGGVFILCGSSGKMPVQIRLTLIEMLKKCGGFETDNDASKYLKKMEDDGRYLQETW